MSIFRASVFGTDLYFEASGCAHSWHLIRNVCEDHDVAYRTATKLENGIIVHDHALENTPAAIGVIITIHHKYAAELKHKVCAQQKQLAKSDRMLARLNARINSLSGKK